ncbi:MAG: STAS domain-containing protein [Bacteroidota bacterium]
MKIKTTDKEGVKIMHFSGNLDTQTSSEAEQLFREILQIGATRILVDFEELDYISSAGLRVLLTTSKRLHGKGQLGICNANEQVKEVFEMTGLANLVFKLYDTEGQALQELSN